MYFSQSEKSNCLSKNDSHSYQCYTFYILHRTLKIAKQFYFITANILSPDVTLSPTFTLTS